MAEVGDYFFVKSADLFESGVPVFKEEAEVLYEETTGDEGARSGNPITLPVGKVLEDYNTIRVALIRPRFSTQSTGLSNIGSAGSLNSLITQVQQQATALENQLDQVYTLAERLGDLYDSGQLSGADLDRRLNQLVTTEDQITTEQELNRLEGERLSAAQQNITFGRGTTVITIPVLQYGASQEFSVAQMKSNANSVTFNAGNAAVTVRASGSGSTMRFSFEEGIAGASFYVRKVWGVRLISSIYVPPEDPEDEEDGDDS